MATTLAMKVKACLSAMETARRALNDADEHLAEIEGTRQLRDQLREELASIKEETNEALEERTRLQATLHEEQARFAAQTEKNNQAIGEQEAQLRDLHVKIKDAQAKTENLLGGLRSLRDRIGME